MKFIKLESITGQYFYINIQDIIFIESYSKNSSYAKVHLRNYEYTLISKKSPEEIYEILIELTK